MQPDIPALDRFFIRFATSPGLRALVWLAALGLLGLTQNLLLIWLAPLPLAMHVYGVFVLRNTHPLLEDKLAETLVTAGREACGLDEDDEAFALRASSGSIERYLLRAVPDTLEMTLVAPLDDYAVVCRLSGTSFPPRWLHPLEFTTREGSQTEIYYTDVNYVEYEDNKLTLHFSNGHTFELNGEGEAKEAVAALRARLRQHKRGHSPRILSE